MKGMCQPDQRRSTDIEKVWNVRKGRNNQYVVMAVQRVFLFSKSTKDVISAQGAWHSLRTLLIMVNCHALCTITQQHP